MQPSSVAFPCNLCQDPRSLAGGNTIARAARLLPTDEHPEAVGFCGEVAGAVRPHARNFLVKHVS